MTDLEINSKVATDVMGWKFLNPDWLREDRSLQQGEFWHPTTSLEQAHEAANKLCLGDSDMYGTFLEYLGNKEACKDCLEFAGAIFTATPRQICEALLAIKKEEEVK